MSHDINKMREGGERIMAALLAGKTVIAYPNTPMAILIYGVCIGLPETKCFTETMFAFCLRESPPPILCSVVNSTPSRIHSNDTSRFTFEVEDITPAIVIDSSGNVLYDGGKSRKKPDAACDAKAEETD